MTNQKSKNKQQAKSAVGISFTDKGWDDYLYWQKENLKIVDEINNLLDECLKNPFKGTGKPEPLTGDLTGFWSRRITDKHRLVYLPEDGGIYVIACRYHYTRH